MAKKSFKDMMKEKTEQLPSNRLSSENNIKQNILVLQELKSLIPALRPDEREQLRDNILVHGITDPLTLWETTVETVQNGLAADAHDRQLFTDLPTDTLIYVLIDGHNRHAIAQEHGKDFRINIMKFENLDQVKDYMINYQLGRRNLNLEQVSYLRGLRYNHLKKSVSGSSKFGGDVAHELAKEYNVSKRTITRDAEFAEGLEKLETALKQDILSGTKKVSKKAIATLSKSNTAFSKLLDEKALDSYVESSVNEKREALSTDTSLASGDSAPIQLHNFIEKDTKHQSVDTTKWSDDTLIQAIQRTVNQEDLRKTEVLLKLEEYIRLLKRS